MKPGRLLILTYSCFAIIKAQVVSPSTEDLEDEYYKLTPTITDNFLPQDEKDAQAIVDSNRNEQVIAGILSYRDKIRRYAIHQKILTKIDAVGSYTSGKQTHTIYYWITNRYPPQRNYNSTSTFMDLCFGLVEEEHVVLGQYLERFFNRLDETWIIIGMVLTKDMGNMIKTFDDNHELTKFKNLRKFQRHPFENMLRRWVRHNRDPIEKGDLDQNSVVADAKALKAEQQDGGWHENRDQIERIFMYKSVKYLRAVIKEFENLSGGTAIEKIIQDNVQACGLNHDLADAYSSIAIYIKDKYKYIADILRKYSDGSDQWAAWFMCIAVVHPKEWLKVDQAFKKDDKEESLTQFILKKLTTDKIMAEMIALIIDPKFKPTTFAVSKIADSS